MSKVRPCRLCGKPFVIGQYCIDRGVVHTAAMDPDSEDAVARLFAIEGRMTRAMIGDRDDFDAHAIEDIHWLLTLQNEMWGELSPSQREIFRKGPRHYVRSEDDNA